MFFPTAGGPGRDRAEPVTPEEGFEQETVPIDEPEALPKPANEKIEQLFEEASRDTSKAVVLKRELDRWNVFKEYEDRFLDLFKKEEDEGQ